MTREFPKNPNVRPPYSDIQGEVDVYIGDLVNAWADLRERSKDYDEDEQKAGNIRLHVIQQVLLRVRAVLDPDSMSEEDWQQAIAKDSYQVALELQGERGPTPK